MRQRERQIRGDKPPLATENFDLFEWKGTSGFRESEPR
jgi:hypothetical protein